MAEEQKPENSAERVVHDLKNDFTIVGRHRVHSWYAWAIIGIVFGMALAIVYLASRSAQFTSSSAQAGMCVDYSESGGGRFVKSIVKETGFKSALWEKVRIFITGTKLDGSQATSEELKAAKGVVDALVAASAKEVEDGCKQRLDSDRAAKRQRCAAALVQCIANNCAAGSVPVQSTENTCSAATLEYHTWSDGVNEIQIVSSFPNEEVRCSCSPKVFSGVGTPGGEDPEQGLVTPEGGETGGPTTPSGEPKSDSSFPSPPPASTEGSL